MFDRFMAGSTEDVDCIYQIDVDYIYQIEYLEYLELGLENNWLPWWISQHNDYKVQLANHAAAFWTNYIFF